jgi:NAD(P)H-flavin reductase/formate hydrogenlyase subunit 6/NADH:ubiquinone oxidoreductase subunit I
LKIIKKKDFTPFVNSLIKNEPKTIGVKSKRDKFVFDTLHSAKELKLDYDVTILPPKKYFFPQWETLFTYDVSNSNITSESTITAENMILLGVHPYDIAAIHQMDIVFTETKSDPYYLKKRESSIIIGVNMQRVSKWCFAASMGCATVDYGYDLMLTDIGQEYYVEIGSLKGEQLLKKYAHMTDPQEGHTAILTQKKGEAEKMCQMHLDFPVEYVPDLLKKNYYNDEFWELHSGNCYSCGSCVMVCPTCYCFDVQDNPGLSLDKGEKLRTWDGCLLEDFATVATGENFRSTKLARYRHRYYKKGVYLFDRFGVIACVGCGRCSSHCLPDIADPVKVFNDLYDKTHKMGMKIKATPSFDVTIKSEEEITFVPKTATIIKKTILTDKETLFEIRLDDNTELGHTPGQFVQVTVFGVGEAPISVTSSPTKKGSFELCIRKVGSVTRAIHRMDTGDKIGIRGPFGNGFDVEALKGHDIVFVAGGLGVVPLRSLIHYVFDKRDHFGSVTILYGCKEPCEVLFADEITEWERRTDTEHYLTVDKCPENVCWEGNIGVITTLVPNVNFTPQTVCALVVGPPVMYQHVVDSLKEMGVPDNHIVISLERRMRCAVGKCGHCQINGLYVCKDGPVFNYEDIKDVPEAL